MSTFPPPDPADDPRAPGPFYDRASPEPPASPTPPKSVDERLQRGVRVAKERLRRVAEGRIEEVDERGGRREGAAYGGEPSIIPKTLADHPMPAVAAAVAVTGILGPGRSLRIASSALRVAGVVASASRIRKNM